MLSSEGYKMFRGTARIVPLTDRFAPYEVTGDWLYKPEWNCWYVNGSSYPAEIVRDICEDQDEMMADLRAKIAVLSDLVLKADNIGEIAAVVEMMYQKYC